MRVSANELTMKLYSTVLDVFSNSVSEEKYIPPPVSPSDLRGNIAQKLREGYTFHGGVCAKCVTPLMSYQGHVTCVTCTKVSEEAMESIIQDEKISNAPSYNAIMSPSESDLSEEAKARDKYVSMEMSEFNERRSKANLIYTAKLLEGYQMRIGELCSECEMPMMKHGDTIQCVVCPPNVKEVVAEAKSGTTTVVEAKNPPKKRLTQAEIIVQRLRGVPPKDETVESELDKAENELLKIMEGNSFEETIHAFFTKKKAHLTAKMKRAEVADTKKDQDCSRNTSKADTDIPETEGVMVDEGTLLTDEESYTLEDCSKFPATLSSVAPPRAPVTPTFQPSASCSLGSLFLPFKSMFASACDTTSEEPMICTGEQMMCAGEPMTYAPFPPKQHNEGRERITRLLEAGWVVSSHSCPRCDLRLFSMKGQTNSDMHFCALCGPITVEYAPAKEEEDDITMLMVNRLMAGWTIVEGDQCTTCHMPTMLDPKTSLVHCPVHGAQQEPDDTYDMNALLNMLNHLKAPDDTISNVKQLMKAKLKVEVPDSYAMPDSTFSMHAFNSMLSLPDPTTSMHTLKNKFTLPDPTTTMGALRRKMLTEPSGLYNRSRSRHGIEPPEPIFLDDIEPYGRTPRRVTSRVTFNDPGEDYENIHSYWNTTPRRKSSFNKRGTPAQYHHSANGYPMQSNIAHRAEP